MPDMPFEIDSDHLASLADHSYFVHDHVLSGREVRDLRKALQTLEADGTLREAQIHRDHESSAGSKKRVRGDSMAWLEDVENTNGRFSLLRSRLHELSRQLNRRAFLGLQHFDVQLARYPGDGAGYERHLDSTGGKQRRRLTAILYLNPDWVPSDGGQLQIFLEDGSTRTIAPKGGRLVVFLSDVLEHAVLPSHATRYAATAWYREEAPFRVSF